VGRFEDDLWANFGMARIVGLCVGALTFLVLLILPSLVVQWLFPRAPEWTTDVIGFVAIVSSVIAATLTWRHLLGKRRN
jgi:membrane protein implicated in regulation of membrane protease activity